MSLLINYTKIISGGILSLLALFGLYKYNSKVDKIDELEDYVEQKDKIIKAQDQQAEISAKVHKQAMENTRMEKDIALNEISVEDKYDKKNTIAQKKIDITSDGVPYEIDS